MPNPKYRERGQRLREARKAAGISQGELAKATDRQQEMISRYEQGLYDIPSDILIYLHEHHNININFILFSLYPIRTEERLIKRSQ